MSAQSITDETLWSSLKQGDGAAFSVLFERHYRSLVNYGKSLMTFPERAQDCIQDVFVDIWLYRDTLTEVSSVKAYLLSCVRKRVARLHERDRVFRQTGTLDEVTFLLDFTVEDQLIADEETAAKAGKLNRLINALPARQKEALYLRYHQGLTVEQIAELMAIHYQSVVNLLYKAMQQLRHEWPGELTLLFSMIFSALD